MRKLKINWNELMDAFDNCRIGYQYYLDIVTGEILYISDEWMDTDEIERLYEQIKSDRKRYLDIPTHSSSEGYQEMQAFAETVKDENLKEKLWIALDGRGAFRRFKDVLLGYPEERQRWFKFKEERLKSEINEWLEENEIELAEEEE